MKPMQIVTILSGLALLFLTGTAGASERLDDGKRMYEKVCSSCHETGVEGAPIVGNKEDWSDRSDLWEAVLVEHAEKGFVKMPAKGNAEYASDYDVSAAAEYMLTLTHPEMKHD
ncbi:MAG: c-type cytochrome [Halioglobus sp.]